MWGQRLSKIDHAKVIQLREDGLSGIQISRRLGVSNATISRILRRDAWRTPKRKSLRTAGTVHRACNQDPKPKRLLPNSSENRSGRPAVTENIQQPLAIIVFIGETGKQHIPKPLTFRPL
jgi:IS30 family transposase